MIYNIIFCVLNLMCASWSNENKNSEQMVEVLLEPVKKQFFCNAEGQVFGSNFNAHDSLTAAIESYLVINSEIPEIEKYNLLSNAIWAAARAGKLDIKNLLTFIKGEESNYLSRPKENYEIFGSISIKFFHGINRRRLASSIKFFRKLPEKYNYKRLIEKNAHLEIRDVPSDYSFFRIPIRARNLSEAYLHGINQIDLLRGIWNWHLPPREYVFNSDQSLKPTNLITLGPADFILKPDGKIAEDFWYRTDFSRAALKIDEHWQSLGSFERKIRRRLRLHPFGIDLENALRRIAQALDYKDKNISFFKLWQVLEKLAAINNANYLQLINRVAFLYEDVALTKGILNHLRIYRNSSVHDGKEHHRIDKYLSQLRGYVEQLLNVHIANPFKATRLTDAVAYLDLPPEGDALINRYNQTKKALKFRRVTTP